MANVVVRLIQRLATGFWPMLGLFALLLLSLYVLGNFAESYESFGRVYILLLFVNILGIALISVLIGVNIWNLVRQFRERAAGARLTARLVAMFIVLALVPVTIVFSFSVKFLRSGIDSWFDVQVEDALNDALKLSKDSLGLQMRTLQRVTERMADDLADVSGQAAVSRLTHMNADSTASELTLLSGDNRVIASSSDDTSQVVPPRPPDGILLQVHQGQPYIGLDPVGGAGLHFRAVVPVPGVGPHGGRVLQALYPVPSKLDELATGVQQAVGKYRQLTYLREPLKQSYVYTLALALGLSVLAAIWAAFFSARRLMLPIHNLAEGTRAVAEGDYDKRLPPSGRDELGFLVRSFNEMTRRLAHASDQARVSRLQVEGQRAYLEAVLERISTGVLTLDTHGVLHTANEAAARILGITLGPRTGQRLADVAAEHAPLAQFLNVVMPHVEQGAGEWDEEFELPGDQGRKIIVCRHASARSPGSGRRLGRRVRRHHGAGAGAAQGRLERGGAACRTRDQEPAHADPAGGRAHAPQAARQAARRRRRDPRPVHLDDRAAGRCAQGHGAGIRRLRRHARSRLRAARSQHAGARSRGPVRQQRRRAGDRARARRAAPGGRGRSRASAPGAAQSHQERAGGPAGGGTPGGDHCDRPDRRRPRRRRRAPCQR